MNFLKFNVLIILWCMIFTAFGLSGFRSGSRTGGGSSRTSSSRTSSSRTSGGGSDGGSSSGSSGSRSSSGTGGSTSFRSSSIRTISGGTSISGIRTLRYTGARFGLSMTRTRYVSSMGLSYGIIYRIRHYNPSFSNGSSTITNDDNLIYATNFTSLPIDVELSDIYVKTKTEDSDTVYNCTNATITAITCEEPDNQTSNMSSDAYNQIGLVFDGACCQNITSMASVCCWVSLVNDNNNDNSNSDYDLTNDFPNDKNKSFVIRQIFISAICLLLTSIFLVCRFCK